MMITPTLFNINPLTKSNHTDNLHQNQIIKIIDKRIEYDMNKIIY